MKNILYCLVTPLAVCTALFGVFIHDTDVQTLYFTEPIDAISFTLEDTEELEVRELLNGTWQPWQATEIEKEFDPTLQESNIIVFADDVQTIQVRTTETTITPKVIRISDEGIQYEVAARLTTPSPKILLRRQWGADDSFLVSGASVNRSDVEPRSSEERTLTAREVECQELQEQYPNDFSTTGLTTTDVQGRSLRWPQRYSKDVHTLVVHHTAAANSGNSRSGYETMRALYAYHANNRGWGDIGYHYIIDDAGQIYEGKAGGKNVVGGHSYCNNVGTLGIALMGNFDIEAPTQAQTQSLQWLIKHLSQEYDIDTANKVRYHGKLRDAILGHKDLIATACPGNILYPALSQIRTNVQRGNINGRVAYNAPPSTPSSSRTLYRTTRSTTSRHQLAFSGQSKIIARPSGFVNATLLMQVGGSGLQPRQSISNIERSDSTIGIWQVNSSGREVRALQSVIAFKQYSPGQIVSMPLRIQVPEQAGSYTVRIGNALLRIDAEGRRTRTVDTSGAPQVPTPQTSTVSQRARTLRVTDRRPITRTTLLPQLSRNRTLGSTRSTRTTTTGTGPNIRIKLGYSAPTMQINLGNDGGTVDGRRAQGAITLSQSGNNCVASQGSRAVGTNVALRLTSNSDTTTITSWDRILNVFRGTIECRVDNGNLLLINELPMEHYLWGLSEQPDSEPYEKQRAFTIAARSYAAHYLDPRYRKFPGKPYDGSDSPAEFQKYSGKAYEVRNATWIKAVNSTSLQVLYYKNQIVKAPYYSSNEGRTLSPAERGWNSFLFAELFDSKPDPWCTGMTLRGHGVGMSGCGSEGQANEGKTGEQILNYYYPGTTLQTL